MSGHLDAARHAGSWAGKAATQRFTDLLQQTYDSVMLTMKEAWRLYLSPDIKPEMKHVFLGRVQSGIALLGRLLPDAEAMMFDSKLVEVNEQAAQIRKYFEERKLASRVVPVGS